ncbi:MAG TPA: response regulator [Stellaceae bacterium]|jgi:hypothetical protein|nr:response regulator [Stellaceae bacterium]
MDDRGARHVVVVDDDPAFRRFVARALEGSGFRVTPAGDFAPAIEIIEQDQTIDLLITDVGLGPGSPHGVALGNMARLRRRHLKVILMSGSYDVERAAQYGDPVAVLQKPFTATRLIETVTLALGGAAETPSASAPRTGRAA